MTFYSTVLINGNSIGWTKFQSTSLLYAQRSAGQREKQWLIGDREMAVGQLSNGRIKLMSVKRATDDTWTDVSALGRTFNYNVVEFVVPGSPKEAPYIGGLAAPPTKDFL